MLMSIIKNWLRPRGDNRALPLRLHVGGQVAHPDWKIFDVRPGPQVDFVGDCTNLAAFADASVCEIYVSHVLEHLGYIEELPRTLREFRRVLVPGGTLRASVPDLDTLCALFADPALSFEEHVHVMRMMFGGQTNPADFHKAGLNEAFLRDYLQAAGFVDVVRADSFGLFDDSSALVFRDRCISVNLSARKPAGA
jgi:predicted SAM-dependent methyltransferase